MNSPYLTTTDLIELTPADQATVNDIRLQIARHQRNENERNKAHEEAVRANTYRRRRTDGAL